MTNKELKLQLKSLILSETLDEQKSIQDGFRIGTLSNEEIYNLIENLIHYYKYNDLNK